MTITAELLEQRELAKEKLFFDINKAMTRNYIKLNYSKPEYKADHNIRYALKHSRTGQLFTKHYNRWTKQFYLVPIFFSSQEIYLLRSLKDARYIKSNGKTLLKYYTDENKLIGHEYQPELLKIVKVKLNYTELKK